MNGQTNTDISLPEGEEWPAESHCARCADLEAELRRVRGDRNELLGRVYELEKRPATRERPAGSVGAPPRRRSSIDRRGSMPPHRMAPHSMPPLPDLQPMPALHEAVAPQGRPLEFQPLPTGAPLNPTPSVGGVMSRSQGLDFGAISRLSPEELDDLPYGLITLDAEGRVVHYNDTESRMAGLPRDRVIGRDFFAEIAPCTRVREFEGRFRELARDPSGVRVQSFDFAFAFAHSEQRVSIVMTPARRRGHFHLALVRRSITAR